MYKQGENSKLFKNQYLSRFLEGREMTPEHVERMKDEMLKPLPMFTCQPTKICLVSMNLSLKLHIIHAISQKAVL
jgi:hypothetical protein